MSGYVIRHAATLRRLLWVDAGLGWSFGLAGMLLHEEAAKLLGFTQGWVLGLAAANCLYASFSLSLALKKVTPVKPVMILILANLAWAAFSVVLAVLHFPDATAIGQFFLATQPLVVGGLGFWEWRQVGKG